ncbi:MAG: LamG-like jellyroll fold domain-containing protein, partial [Balneolaceae bacterium]
GDVDSRGSTVTSKNGAPAHRWTHIAGTYDGQFIKIYINGVLDNTKQLSRTINSNSYSLNIGSNASTTANFFSGQLDEIRIWNSSRTASEIAGNYLEELNGSESGLAAYYTFSGATSADGAGSNDLSIVGDNAMIATPGAVPVSPDLYADNENDQAALVWDERLGSNSENKASSYKIYRSTQADGSDRQELATIDGETTSYTDTGADNNQTYFYEVTSLNASGDESDYSHMVSASPYSVRGGGSLHLSKNAYGVLSHRPSLDIMETDLTIQAWVKHDGNSDEDAVIVAKGTNSYGYLLRFDGEGQAPSLAFAIGDVDANGSTIVSNSSIPANQWTHVAGTYD